MNRKRRGVKQFRGLFFPWLMLPWQVLLELWWNTYSKEHKMTELISTLILFVDQTLIYWVPFLVGVGYALKHCTRLSNNLIPLAEIGIGAIIGLLFGLATYADSELGFLTVLGFAGQGALIGIIAIALYDMIHGVIKQRGLCKLEKKEKAKKEGELK